MTINLQDFIINRMRMSHIYQPVMLKVLLENDGEATVDQIASSLLSYDSSQVEYYGLRTKVMVGKVLTANGVVEPIKTGRKTTGYKLNGDNLTHQQNADLIELCMQKIEDYISDKGGDIWSHRGPGSGYVSGSIRYQVLKRGADALSNFQALCVTCNTNKRNTDDTDFRDVAESYNNRLNDCLFCNDYAGRLIAENELCFAIRDGFPVTEHHTLIIPKRHVADYFDLYQPELNAIHQMIAEQRAAIRETDSSVLGFNVGINSGAVAGQTIFHAHIHLIPRREGDVVDPRGGVRGVIPSKQGY